MPQLAIAPVRHYWVDPGYTDNLESLCIIQEELEETDGEEDIWRMQGLSGR